MNAIAASYDAILLLSAQIGAVLSLAGLVIRVLLAAWPSMPPELSRALRALLAALPDILKSFATASGSKPWPRPPAEGEVSNAPDTQNQQPPANRE